MRTEDFKEFIKTAKKFKKNNSGIIQEEHLLFSGSTVTTFGTKLTEGFTFISIDLDCPPMETFSVPMADIEKIVNKVKDSPIDFALDGENVKVTTNKGEFTFASEDMENYPETPSVSEHYCKLDKETRFLIGKAVNYTATDELRPVMNGVLMQQDYIVGSNAHILCFYKQETERSSDVIIPKEIAKYVSGCKSDLDMFLSEDKVWLSVKNDNLTIITKQVYGKYPNWKSVVPQDNPISVTLKRKEFEEVLDVATISAPPTNMIAFTAKDGKVNLKTQNIDFNKSFTKDIDAKLDGEISIGFNLLFMLNILKTEDGDKVEINFSSPERAMIINDSVLLMPMAING